MRNWLKTYKTLYCIVGIATALAVGVLSLLMQRYVYPSLEEQYIFLYDSDYLRASVGEVGGFSMLLGAVLTQFFIWPTAAALITALLYCLIAWMLCLVGTKRQAPLWTSAFAAAPCCCLFLCLESNSFEYQGIVALALACAAVALYVRAIPQTSWAMRTAIGVLLAILLYVTAGAMAIVYALSALVLDILSKDTRKYLSLVYVAAVAVCAYAAYATGWVATAAEAFTPAMYYDMGATYYMLAYAMAAVVAYVVAISLLRGDAVGKRQVAGAIVAAALCLGATMAVYPKVHSASGYENQQQRYYARHGQWQKIAAMPYHGESTPYTSYRFLALAKQGRLAQQMNAYKPYISYYLQNKPKVKKRDQQIYSDIYYQCDYMAAARRSAFDTNIVTPGAFNPEETYKLAVINIAFGDYGVAEKMIAKLEKTLFYRDKARALRRFLNDDAAVEADPWLSAKRKAIPEANDYMSPKGTQRDLQYIVGVNPDQVCASEFLKAFKMLTNQTVQ